jgi:hypothetical protein
VILHHDQVAKPAKGRFFPIKVPEVYKLTRSLGFTPPEGRARPSVSLRNPRATMEHKILVAAYYPKEEITFYSFPESFDRARAGAIVKLALRHLAEQKAEATLRDARQELIYFRAYLKDETQLTITRRTRTFTRAKYRGRDKMTHAFKPKGVKTDERILQSITIT